MKVTLHCCIRMAATGFVYSFCAADIVGQYTMMVLGPSALVAFVTLLSLWSLPCSPHSCAVSLFHNSICPAFPRTPVDRVTLKTHLIITFRAHPMPSWWLALFSLLQLIKSLSSLSNKNSVVFVSSFCFSTRLPSLETIIVSRPRSRVVCLSSRWIYRFSI